MIYKERLDRIKIFTATLIGISGLLSARLSSYLIHHWYPTRPAVVDLVHDLLPYYQWMEIVADLVVVGSLILFLYILSKRLHTFNQVVVSIGLLYFFRSILNLITPLGKPLGNDTSHGLLKEFYHQAGMFPSGHTALVFLIYFSIPKEYRILKGIALILGVIEVISMDLSWGHYSIDIAGGIMLAYCVHKLVENYGGWFLLAGAKDK